MVTATSTIKRFQNPAYIQNQSLSLANTDEKIVRIASSRADKFLTSYLSSGSTVGLSEGRAGVEIFPKFLTRLGSEKFASVSIKYIMQFIEQIVANKIIINSTMVP